jgi:hypothetical protein
LNPSGSFDAFQINVVRMAPGYANLRLVDDGCDLGWSDPAANLITGVTYNQYDLSPTPGDINPEIPHTCGGSGGGGSGGGGSGGGSGGGGSLPPNIPLPAGIWLLASALGVLGLARRRTGDGQSTSR